MKMNKILAAMAATAISATAFAAMSISSASAEEVGTIGLYGQVDDLNGNSITQWNADAAKSNGSTVVTCDGNAQYEVTWELSGDDITKIDFLIVETDFNKDQYPDLTFTIDEVYFDGVSQSFTNTDAAYNLKYYEGNGRARAYLTDTWNVNGTDLGIAASNDNSFKSQIKVVFTIGGLYNDGTSNVTATEPTTDGSSDDTTTTTTTAAGSSDDTATTTTTAASGDSATTTTTAKDSSKKDSKTTTKAADGTVASASTGDLGAGAAVTALAVAGVAAFVARKKD